MDNLRNLGNKLAVASALSTALSTPAPNYFLEGCNAAMNSGGKLSPCQREDYLRNDWKFPKLCGPIRTTSRDNAAQ